ncbi:class I adenylate-forming enzyme family protein [Rhizobium sp. C4]|uniref:class I adenylate-forming enzyme family protein n=1 Tax=Rhizobium sp. C4 TaxID=1349800 RepID=UPI001E45BCA7|nr:class I adenylate-forming enzyme family protein [Rhizobium sp. C4]MCD2172242.1 acyl--CoA ligase [Rhizobium sp. C4]
MPNLTTTTGERAFDLVRRWAQDTPDAAALLSGSSSLSYADLERAVGETARFLTEQGARAGDRIFIVAENDLVAPLMMFAAQVLDAWPCIVNARVAATEMEALLPVVDPRLVIIAPTPSREAATFSGRVGTTVVDAGAAGEVSVATLRCGEPEPVKQDPAEQTALILFTSGTTGLPKAVMLSHAALVGIGRTLAQVRQVRAGGRYDGGSPLSHVMGISTLMSSMAGGASLSFTGRVNVPDVVQRIADGSLTHLSFVPTVYARIVDHILTEGVDISRSRLEYISSGGAPLDPTLKAAIERLFRVRLVNGYGMTECCPVARTKPDRDYDHDSIGYAEPGAAVRVVREDGSDAAAGETGELWAQALGMMQGYYRNPQATSEALRDGGWIATGDLATLAEDGEIRIVGRKKEMIIRSGFNVYPAEVEAAINRHAGVLQSAVLGVKRPDGNEEVVAFVQPRQDLEVAEDDLLRHLRAELAPYKIPTRVFMREALPLGSTGKILKRQLLDELLAG